VAGGLRSEEGVPIPEDQVHGAQPGWHPQAEPAGHPSRCRKPRLDGLACIRSERGRLIDVTLTHLLTFRRASPSYG
jgi:hypothetical protein